MPTFEDWLNDPISIINNIFCSDKYKFDSKVQEYFQNKLNVEKNYYAIPSLNEVPLHEIKPNSLVRYRCMIQDVFNPVYYTNAQRIRNKHNGDVSYMSLKYRESVDVPEGYEIDGDILQEHLDELRIGGGEKAESKGEGFKTNLEQRVTFYCVPIPGESKWTKQSYKMPTNGSALSNASNSASNNMNRASKRTIDGENEQPTADQPTTRDVNESDEKENQMESSVVDATSAYAPTICHEKDTDTTTTLCTVCYKYRIHHAKKSGSGSGSGSSVVGHEDVLKTVNVTKKTRVDDEKTTTSVDQNGKRWTSADLNFPLGDGEKGHPCLVKVYDNFDEFKLNDMVEFVGILSQDPSLAYEHDEHTYFMENAGGGGGVGQDWQPEMQEERREEETKTETMRVVDETSEGSGGGGGANAAVMVESDHTYCKCVTTAAVPADGELVDVSVTRQVKHTHSHKKVVLSAYPPSLVPRLHCVLSHKLEHNNPLLGRPWCNQKNSNSKTEEDEAKSNDYWNKQLDEFVSTLKTSSSSSASQMCPSGDALNILRKEIIDAFQELLLGDSLAAEYLLMHLLSSV